VLRAISRESQVSKL